MSVRPLKPADWVLLLDPRKESRTPSRLLSWPLAVLARAKAARPVAEQILTLGKAGTIHARRLAAARLRHQARTLHRSKTEREAWRKGEDVVRILFEELAPSFKERNGGYTRIVKLGQRQGDAAQRAILEWVDFSGPAAEPATAKAETHAAEADK